MNPEQEKIAELELIASWASQMGYGVVRDACRAASYHLKLLLELRNQPKSLEERITPK